MKLTSRIKQRTTPMAIRWRKLAAGRLSIFDQKGDIAILRRIMAAADQAGRSSDFYPIKCAGKINAGATTRTGA